MLLKTEVVVVPDVLLAKTFIDTPSVFNPFAVLIGARDMDSLLSKAIAEPVDAESLGVGTVSLLQLDMMIVSVRSVAICVFILLLVYYLLPNRVVDPAREGVIDECRFSDSLSR